MKIAISASKKLDPCPFCGGEAFLLDMGSRRYHISCTKCPAFMGQVWGDAETKPTLVKLWNTREDK